MPRMRHAKTRFRQLLEAPDWRAHLPEVAGEGLSAVGPLLSFLLLSPCLRHRAAVALGAVVAGLEREQPEAVRNIMRRLMWHMNEESGNIGWGIPEAFAEACCASELAAKDFHRVLISYVIELEKDDNYCDHDVLRRSSYWGIGRLAQVRPALAEWARPWLRRGLEDPDVICRGMAAWALRQLPPDMMDAPLLRRLAEQGPDAACEIFDGEAMRATSVRELAAGGKELS